MWREYRCGEYEDVEDVENVGVEGVRMWKV